MFRMLDDRDYRASIQAGFDEVRRNLGTGNGAKNMADLVLSMLAKNNTQQIKNEKTEAN